MPTLSLLSPHTVFSAGEAVRFSCTVLLGHHLNDFHLYKRGIATPLVTQRVDSAQTRVELTLSDLETTHQGSYSCLYRIKGSSPSSLLSSPPSNSINITVGELSGSYSVRYKMEENKSFLLRYALKFSFNMFRIDSSTSSFHSIFKTCSPY